MNSEYDPGQFTQPQQDRLQETNDRVSHQENLAAQRGRTSPTDPNFPSPRGISSSALVEYRIRKFIRKVFGG